MNTMNDISEPISVAEGHTEIPTAPQADAPPSLPDFMSVVPEKYREVQWVKDTAKSEKPYEAFLISLRMLKKLLVKNQKL